ncbi:hypothetical protein [Rhodoblastus sp.]|uniref:hypothetical protein n=1 Tax=Rhodoblastus sp. TaxID=1962975 RepID=UPI003F9D91ED
MSPKVDAVEIPIAFLLAATAHGIRGGAPEGAKVFFNAPMNAAARMPRRFVCVRGACGATLVRRARDEAAKGRK